VKGLRWLAAVIGFGIGTMNSSSAETASPQSGPEQAVTVRFSYGSTDLSRLFVLEEKLESAISDAKAGEYGGNEVAVDGSDGILYMYGPDADRLFRTIEPILKTTSFMSGAEVTVRYGPAANGVMERKITIGP